MDLTTDTAAVLGLIERTPAQPGRRKVIAIAGPPGSGKSTLAAEVVAALNHQHAGQAVLVPMDGFHLDNATLDHAGLRAIKGAPRTFDVAGFIAKVRELGAAGHAGRFPVFDRHADCTVPDAGHVSAETAIIVVEGNYLLLSEAPWSGLRDVTDASVLLRPSFATLEARLMSRWTSLGLSQDEAYRKTHGNDLVNARHVLDNSRTADLVLNEGTDEGAA